MKFIQLVLSAALMAALLTGLSGCVTSKSNNTFNKDNEAAASYNLQLGIDYFRQGNLNQAKDKMERALEQSPRNAQAHMFAGLLYDRLNDSSKAESHFNRALSLDGENSDIGNAYAAFLCRRGQFEKGEKLALEASRNPLYRTPEAALMNAGNCAFDAGDLVRAEQHFRSVLRAQPKFTPALYQMANLELKAGNILPARGFLERYMQATRPDAAALWLAVRIERAAGNQISASNYARQLKEQFPAADETKALIESERKPNS